MASGSLEVTQGPQSSRLPQNASTMDHFSLNLGFFIAFKKSEGFGGGKGYRWAADKIASKFDEEAIPILELEKLNHEPLEYAEAQRQKVIGMTFAEGKVGSLFWILRKSNTVSFMFDEDDPEYDYVGIELRSPLLWYGDWAEITKICDLLVLMDDFILHFNSSAALHISVAKETMTHLELQKTAAFFWLFEPHLLELCHPGRADTLDCATLSSNSRTANIAVIAQKERTQNQIDGSTLQALLQYFPRINAYFKDMAEYRALANIWRTTTFEELRFMTSCSLGAFATREPLIVAFQDFSKVDGVMMDLAKPIEMVQVRAFQGSLDPNFITNCVKLSAACVDVASLPAKDFQDLLRKIYDTDRVLDILPLLGLGDQVDYWKALMEGYKRELDLQDSNDSSEAEE